MITWGSFILSLAAIVLAMKRSSGPVKLYFWSQLLATPVVFLGARMLGNRSDVYLYLYIAVTLPIFETCCFIASRARNDELLTSALVGTISGCVAVTGMSSITFASGFVLLQGVVLSALAMAMLHAAPDSGDEVAVGFISMFCAILSIFSFGYVQHTEWELANRWLPSTTGIVAFGWLGLKYNNREVVQ